ncbi:DUF952 domain-containing protein [Actinomadura rupiterrae]|uniref:DUF952 domain-containing protein n=1 Tax=Actinomadura rupiterrae TaxID=559627 RepID=UPI0020A3F1F6|nr:DUF952 domain-containing protein [Actinomadura rupiterrae]MCP2340459.1 uncharacterized protein (DUF952 family) [Actinomadura rupiterrae]
MTDQTPSSPPETVLHIAERARWESARASGESYAMSTRGRTLAEEGFIHCSSDLDQVRTVLGAFYKDVPPSDLVLLTVSTQGLDVRLEPADGDLFPHIYGPIPLSAVIEVRPVPDNR